jgi:antitoxin component HigA of HigAB toxin-antitoxin module
MEKLKKVIEQYGRWNGLSMYINRIEAHIDSDFSHAIENVKALLETIGKEVCKSKGVEIEATSKIHSILKKAFNAVGYSSDDFVIQISSALATIGQKMGELRNKIGSTSHGMSLEELEVRNNKVDSLTKEFLIDSTVIIACFLIRNFENENPRATTSDETKMLFPEQEDFNDFWDDSYGEFLMGEYSYSASEILYYVDYPAYETEYEAYLNRKGDDE